MRRSIALRTLLSASVVLTLAARVTATPTHAAGISTPMPPIPSQTQHSSRLSASEVRLLSAQADQHVVVILHNQYKYLLHGNASRASRVAAVSGAITADAARQRVQSEVQQVGTHVHAFNLINAIAATVSEKEIARLKADPGVQAVVPDRLIPAPSSPSMQLGGVAAPNDSFIPPCEDQVRLDPEALQLTDTAFTDTARLQAQNIVTGTGVTVAFIADGLDINNPDFIRRDGSHVFVDYQDFSGDGPNAPTAGGEAFGDASSIAAQGKQIYSVNAFVNTSHKRTDADCPKIRVLGMAPGASLMGLKVFGSSGMANGSTIAQAVEYAVAHGTNIINESLGGNPYPDNANDPLSLANDAAVAAGVTVVGSTGDAGTASTIGSPETDPNIIAAGATTQFRLYKDITYQAFQLGNGDYEGSDCDVNPLTCRNGDNISSLSSAGFSQTGPRTVDVVAPGDLGWAVCTPNTDLYADCLDDNGQPSPIEVFGGTSEAAPLTSGEAALVIQAYRQTHGGATPSPAVVKQIIMSTARDLGIPSYEQGAGLIDSLKAVQAAEAYPGATGTPSGTTLLTSPNAFTATDNPNTPQGFTVAVTNTGASAQTVTPTVRTLDTPFYSQTFTPVLDPATDAAFINDVGSKRPYVTQTFDVPAGADRLDAAISWNVTKAITSIVYLALLDPQGRYAAYSLPQDAGSPFATSGYGHVDVRNPGAGTWTAIIATRPIPSQGYNGYAGPVQLSVSASKFTSAGSVSPASLTLAPGASGSITVNVNTPATPGDQSAEVAFDNGSDTSAAGAIPITLRSLIPTPQTASSGTVTTTFTGILTGGNGRFGSPGQTLTYAFDVPAGLSDLDLSTAITDTGYNLEGLLVPPDGQPIDVQSTVTKTDPNTGLPTAYTDTLQFFRRDPEAGRWRFVFFINDNSSGRQTSLPFTGAITYNGVRVQAPGVPDSAAVTLTQGMPVTVPVTVTNTGNTTKSFFVDPRSAAPTTLSLGAYDTSLPLASSDLIPTFFVPSESTRLVVETESYSPTVPVDLDLANVNGAAPYGGTDSPEIRGMPTIDPQTGNYASIAQSSAPEVAPGLWQGVPSQFGPYTDTVTPVSATTAAAVETQDFDLQAVPNTGDLYAVEAGLTSPDSYKPLRLAPGQTGVISVVITPTATVGSEVKGILYVDTFSPFTASGDELKAIPYDYTVAAAVPPVGPPTTTPELGSGELLATGLVPILAALLYRRRTRRADPARDARDKEDMPG